MTYTFDDAIEEIENLQGSAGYATQGEPEALRFSGLDVNWFLNEATQVIEKLREEYAPTVEMTKEQARVLNEYREPDLYDGDCAFYVFFDETCVPRLNSMRDTSLYDNLTEVQLMQAWLHHDDIQIIDKE